MDGGVNIEKMKQALAITESIYKKEKQISEIKKIQNDAWNGISNAIFQVSGSEWFKKVPKTTEELAKQNAEIKMMDTQLKVAGETLTKKLKDALPNIQKQAQEAAKSFTREFRVTAVEFEKIGLSPDMKKPLEGVLENMKNVVSGSKDWDEVLGAMPNTIRENEQVLDMLKKDFEEQIQIQEKGHKLLTGDLTFINDITDKYEKQRVLTALAEGRIDEYIKSQGYNALAVLQTSENIANAIGEEATAMIVFKEQADEAKKTLGETHKNVISIGQGLKAWAMNIAKGIIPRMLEFDKIIHDTQKTTGIMLTENSEKMTTLTRKTSEFGMSIQDTATFMSVLGDELKTTDFDLLAGAADDLKAIQLATGISAENLGTITGEMMRFGQSSKDVELAMQEANVYAKQFGVNTKKVLEGMSRNIAKMRQMGFVEGEKSLIKMVATAERLRMNVDEIFDVAKKARQIEGAMEMAAELQLAGGSFANINPMDLLSASRQGPLELQKILTQMGGDIGKFDKETGKYKFDPVDVDRLQIVADATGQSLDSIQNMIAKNAEDNKKLSMFPSDMFSIEGLDPDAVKAQISDAIEIGEDGQLKIKEGNIFGAKSLDDLKNMTKKDMQERLKQAEEDAKRLEEQAKQNQGFQDAMVAMKDALLNIFTYFQPIVEKITQVFQWVAKVLNALGPGAKWVVGILALSLMMPKLIAVLGKTAFSFNPLNWGKIFKSGGLKGAMDAATGKSPVDSAGDLATKSDKVKPKAGDGLRQFASNLSRISRMKIDLKGIAKFALAIGMLLVPVAGIALLFGKLGGDPLILLSMAAGLVGIAFAMRLISKVKVDMKNILMMALAMGIVGLALIPFAFAASLMVGVDWMEVLMGIGILTLVVLGLMLLGAMMMGPQLIALMLGVLILVSVALSLLVVGAAFLVLAKGLNALATVDWTLFSGIGPALKEVGSAMMGFAIAGLMFANPIVLVGMLLMIGTMVAISIVLIPLAMALEMGGKGLDSMSAGVLKLGESLSKLDFAKLQELKSFSQAMALAALGGPAIGALISLVTALGKIGGGKSEEKGGGTKTLVVQLKLPNGRIIQEEIIKDIDKVS